MAGNVTEQISSIYSSLSSFFGQKASAVNGTGSFPTFGSIITGLDSSELNRYANDCAGDAASFSAGASVDAVQLSAAASREYVMRIRGKSDYYASSYSESTSEAGYYDSMKYSSSGTLTGVTEN